ncbi:MAG: stage II sporulation protein R [Clostridia bacterium]|nr:stage II sporulation protein R [Clostridia bacterium]
MGNKKINKVTIIAIFSFVVLNIYLGIKIYLKVNNDNSIVRLHVVANSNSVSDQIEKLKIHSKIQDYLNALVVNDTQDMMNTLKNNSNEILEIVDTTLKEDNIDYYSYMKIGKIKYDKKESILIDMPEGSYESMQIILGKGDGKNIWSFIFPKEENIEKIENFNTILPNLSNIYEDDIEKEQAEEITYQFKSLEILNQIKNKIKSIL